MRFLTNLRRSPLQRIPWHHCNHIFPVRPLPSRVHTNDFSKSGFLRLQNTATLICTQHVSDVKGSTGSNDLHKSAGGLDAKASRKDMTTLIASYTGTANPSQFVIGFLAANARATGRDIQEDCRSTLRLTASQVCSYFQVAGHSLFLNYIPCYIRNLCGELAARFVIAPAGVCQ